MSSTISLANALLNASVNGSTYTGNAINYLALYSTNNTADTPGQELSGSGYSRQPISFEAAAGGVVTPNVSVVFTANGSNWVGVRSAAICTASTGGDRLYWDNFPQVTVLDGKSLYFNANSVSITME